MNRIKGAISFTKRFKLVSFCIALMTLFLPSAYGFTPQPGSPLASRSHPRLHITENTLPGLRQAIAQHYKNEFQQYVNWAANTSEQVKGNGISEAGHDPLRALMVHQAFIAALGQVPGISYPISLEEYANRAINRLISRLDAGQSLSYVAALIYDWAYSYMDNSQRSHIANQIRSRRISHPIFDHSISNPEIKPEQMFSSKYYEGCYAWYIALALWGDGFIDTEADKALDSFRTVMLNYGYLDAQNFIAGNEGGWPEWIGYSSWHPRTHLLNVDGWRTATGEDFIAHAGEIDGNAIKNYPKFIAYAMDPHKYINNHYTYVRTGSAETTDTSLTHRSMREQIYILPRMLLQSGLQNEAGLLRYLTERYEVKWPKYDHFYLWGFLGIPHSETAVSPEALGLPKSLWSKNLGMFFARTGFNSPADSVVSVTDSHFRSHTKRGPDRWPGFTLAKFGTLVNTRNVAHRGYGNLNEYPGGHPLNIVYFEGDHILNRSIISGPSELRDAANGNGDYDHGGIEQVSRKDGHFYHIRANRSRQLQDGIKHTREYVWLPGNDPEKDSDFLVVYDRTFAPSAPEWVYHVPWKPTGLNYNSTQDISTGNGEGDRLGVAYTGSDIIIKELSSLGGERDNDSGTDDYTNGVTTHGVAFCKTLLPAEARVEVTRVARFDNEVIKRQHDLAIKSHRWQVSVKPTQTKSDHRFLHVFQTADADQVSSMVTSNFVQAGDTMQGVFIERERGDRSNYIVLFGREEEIMDGPLTYSVLGQGYTKQVITGLRPNTIYIIEDVTDSGASTTSKATESDVELWDYKGADSNIAYGVLYFKTSLTGNHTFNIRPSGEYGSNPPDKPSNLRIKYD